MGDRAWIGEAVWLVSSMECAVCNHEWVAIFPVEASVLECAGCGYMNPVPPDAAQWDETEDLEADVRDADDPIL